MDDSFLEGGALGLGSNEPAPELATFKMAADAASDLSDQDDVLNRVDHEEFDPRPVL